VRKARTRLRLPGSKNANPSTENSDEDERTTPIGLFNYAESYRLSAIALNEAQVQVPHRYAPISFLYYHSIELYLKSYLRGHGVTNKELRQRHGHKVGTLSDSAQRLGLDISEDDARILSWMTRTDVAIRFRYIRTGAYALPSEETFNKVTWNLRQAVGESLRKLDLPIRM
jgi:hypothetical protein